ncbi:ornithine decarboxylase [Actinoplanes sp. NBRC 103695]|uniref:ornithine decarboxylase n=1 Tax=Actinoplanes sp. NBRC 103695 TaxID=3032202 RepID=UPI00249FA9ED|nr:ornithine decarboxylase [Actinoplanes sp. NBRC 103695]GLZ01185.1 lysine/ornithine decarboxylase [Actinoplanes sp. NBRC 103695]
MPDSVPLRSALASATSDGIIYDLTGIVQRHDDLLRELPGARVRFAVKACPVDDVLSALGGAGAGFDAAGPYEIAQALRTGVPVERVHYGNTVKSDRDIAEAYRMGVRLFATDSIADVRAIAAHAPGSRVFSRLAVSGSGALWRLTGKFGCSPDEAVEVLDTARSLGLVPAGLSLHVGSQQMTVAAWRNAFDVVAAALAGLVARGIDLDHVNLGGGLPALGYLDRSGRPLRPPLDLILTAIRDGMARLRTVARGPLGFVIEPGRHLVADHGAIRSHVVRLTGRQGRDGRRERWLYLSCGRFNGLYELDQIQYRLEFPGHADGHRVPAVVAGPTCDSDDAFDPGSPVLVPSGLRSGDPVWILSAGAYAVSYTTVGFNGFAPLPYHTVGALPRMAPC